MAYQIAFDLYESATQQFLGRVLQALRATAPIPAATNKIVKVPVEGAAKEEASGESSSEATEGEKKPERKMESLVSQMKFSFGSRYTVCLSSFGRTALKGFK
jgi:26S proteasome regulatory subunit N2